MNTISLISSISYNTEAFLHCRLDALHEGGVIDWWHYIKHKAESDETKDHIHFVVQPSRRVDTEALRREFIEPVLNCDPLGVLPFHKSKISDWLLYGIHDARYLISKGDSREFHYSKDNIVSSDPELVAEQFRDTKSPLQLKIDLVQKLSREGKNWGDILSSGIIAVNEVYFYQRLFDELNRPRLHRSNGSSHE